ncbi:hypothetical protein D3C76_1132550 [compost metagenome]
MLPTMDKHDHDQVIFCRFLINAIKNKVHLVPIKHLTLIIELNKSYLVRRVTFQLLNRRIFALGIARIGRA